MLSPHPQTWIKLNQILFFKLVTFCKWLRNFSFFAFLHATAILNSQGILEDLTLFEELPPKSILKKAAIDVEHPKTSAPKYAVCFVCFALGRAGISTISHYVEEKYLIFFVLFSILSLTDILLTFSFYYSQKEVYPPTFLIVFDSYSSHYEASEVCGIWCSYLCL